MRTRSKRPSLDSRAFRDAVRDIVAAEGWFEMMLEPEPRPGIRWIASRTATA